MIRLEVWQFVLLMLLCDACGVATVLAYRVLRRWTAPEKYGASLRR